MTLVSPVCSAHRTNGEPCRARAMHGGKVCVVHGGKARQVREKAARTLVELSYPAAVELGDLMKHKTPNIRLAAANSILDRNGLKGVERSEVDNQVTVTVTYEDVALAHSIVDVPIKALVERNGHVEDDDGG